MDATWWNGDDDRDDLFDPADDFDEDPEGEDSEGEDPRDDPPSDRVAWDLEYQEQCRLEDEADERITR